MSIKSIFNKFLYDEGEEQEFNTGYPEVDETGYDYSGETEIDLGAAEPKSASGTSISSGSSIEMVVVKPEKLETVTQIADYLVDRKTILLNLEETNKETARRLIDFLNGVAYAINGNLKKVANCTYVITPSNVDVSGEQIKDSQENNDLV